MGLGAGLLPRRVSGRAEIALLTGYAVVAAYGYGFAMKMWFWPFSPAADTALSYLPGAGVGENLHRFVLFTVATSALGWDTGRAITNAAAVLLLGPAVLAALRRASRRAAFEAPVVFQPSASARSVDPS